MEGMTGYAWRRDVLMEVDLNAVIEEKGDDVGISAMMNE